MTHDRVGQAGSRSWDADGLLLRLGGDRALAVECVEIFCRDATDRLATIAAGLASAPTDSIARQFHSLKGAAGTAGAEAFEHAAAQAERAAQAADLELLAALVTDMTVELDRIRGEVARLGPIDAPVVAPVRR